jgi:hypothetical protein
MEKFFRTHAGRLSLILGGVDLALLGAASLAEDPAITALLVALLPMLSIAAGIYIVLLATIEVGDLLPVGLFSTMLFLGGVFVFGLSNATGAGPASGVVLISVGIIFALLGLRPEIHALRHPLERSL